MLNANELVYRYKKQSEKSSKAEGKKENKKKGKKKSGAIKEEEGGIKSGAGTGKNDH